MTRGKMSLVEVNEVNTNRSKTITKSGFLIGCFEFPGTLTGSSLVPSIFLRFRFFLVIWCRGSWCRLSRWSSEKWKGQVAQVAKRVKRVKRTWSSGQSVEAVAPASRDQNNLQILLKEHAGWLPNQQVLFRKRYVLILLALIINTRQKSGADNVLGVLPDSLWPTPLARPIGPALRGPPPDSYVSHYICRLNQKGISFPCLFLRRVSDIPFITKSSFLANIFWDHCIFISSLKLKNKLRTYIPDLLQTS